VFSFAGKLKLPSEGKGQYYVYFHSSWRLDADVLLMRLFYPEDGGNTFL
jgi:hypothetical protein